LTDGRLCPCKCTIVCIYACMHACMLRVRRQAVMSSLSQQVHDPLAQSYEAKYVCLMHIRCDCSQASDVVVQGRGSAQRYLSCLRTMALHAPAPPLQHAQPPSPPPSVRGCCLCGWCQALTAFCSPPSALLHHFVSCTHTHSFQTAGVMVNEEQEVGKAMGTHHHSIKLRSQLQERFWGN
jgi:hypothetical protein